MFSQALERAPAPEAPCRGAADQMALPVAVESPSRGSGPVSPRFQRLADSLLLHMCSCFGFSWYQNSPTLSAFIVSYKISNRTAQAGNWTHAEGHGERARITSQPFAIWLPPPFSAQHPPSLPPCPPNYSASTWPPCSPGSLCAVSPSLFWLLLPQGADMPGMPTLPTPWDGFLLLTQHYLMHYSLRAPGRSPCRTHPWPSACFLC